MTFSFREHKPTNPYQKAWFYLAPTVVGSSPASAVKTTGEAGGLSKPYKGMIQPRLKAHEKFANRKCLLAAPLPGGGYFICL